MELNSEMPRLSATAEGLLDLLEDDNLRIQRSNSGEIDPAVAELAKELQVRQLYVRNELPDLGSGDLGLDVLEPETASSNSTDECCDGLAAEDSVSHVLELALDMGYDYIMAPERMLIAPCSSPASNDEREEDQVLSDQNTLFPRLPQAEIADDADDFTPIILKELVNQSDSKIQVENDGGDEPEIVKEIGLERNVSEDEDFFPEIMEEVMNVMQKEGDDEDLDFVEFVEEIMKEVPSEDDEDSYSTNWPPLPSPEFQFSPMPQALQQRASLTFQRLPTQASTHRMPPPPPTFQRPPFARLQQPAPLHFQELLPPLPVRQQMMRPWCPFNVHQQEPIQNCWK